MSSPSLAASCGRACALSTLAHSPYNGRLDASRKGGPMAGDVKIDTVRSYSSGTPGRSLNSARHNHFVLDSPSGPNEALTNGEAFLSGISSCGVTLIEGHAQQQGIPVKTMQVTIEGIRNLAAPNSFQAINMRFEIMGVDQGQAEALVETYKSR